MAKLKFKDENDNFIPVVQDVKVNGKSVFDGEEATIIMEKNYKINVNKSSFPEHIYIPNDDLIWIRLNKPKFITVITTSNEITLQLQKTSSNKLEYGAITNQGTYAWYSYFLTIKATDTYATGCDGFWVGSTTAPTLPLQTQNKTYVLKYVNGVLKWVEEN